MKPIFLEIIMAPKFDEGALEVLVKREEPASAQKSIWIKGDVDPPNSM